MRTSRRDGCDVGRFTQSRHLNSSRDDASDRKTSSRCRGQEGGGEGYCGQGHTSARRHAYLCRRAERTGESPMQMMRLYRAPGNRQISGTGQYRPFSTVREHSNIARQWRRMGDSCLTLALAPIRFSQPPRSRGVLNGGPPSRGGKKKGK